MIFKYHWEWLGNYISQFPQESGMLLIRTHRHSSHCHEPDLCLQQESQCSPSYHLPNHPLKGCVDQSLVKTEAFFFFYYLSLLLVHFITSLCFSLGRLCPPRVSFSSWCTYRSLCYSSFHPLWSPADVLIYCMHHLSSYVIVCLRLSCWEDISSHDWMLPYFWQLKDTEKALMPKLTAYLPEWYRCDNFSPV